METKRKFNPLVNELFSVDSHIEIYIPPTEDTSLINNSEIAQRLKTAFPEDNIEILVN